MIKPRNRSAIVNRIFQKLVILLQLIAAAHNHRF